MNETENYSRKDFRTEIGMFFDSDLWGTALIIWFCIANEMYYRDLDIPISWEYSPGLSEDPRENDDPIYEICSRLSDNDLLYFGKVYSRYCILLEKHGKSY